ncbi:MAG: hypothetical protein AB7O98_11275 [Hyphomonadaceae bacterium]
MLVANEGRFSRAIAGVFRWLTSRVGLFWVWIVIDLTVLGALLYWHFERELIFRNAGDWLWLMAAASLLLLPLLLLLLDASDNYSSGPGPALPVATLLVLFCLSAVAVLNHYLAWNLFSSDHHLQVQAIFFAFFAVAFIPRIWSAADFSSFEAKRRSERALAARQTFMAAQRARYPDIAPAAPSNQLREEHDATSLSALLVTTAVLTIGVLAYLAGNGSSFSIQSAFGFGLCFVVIGLFIAVIAVDAFADIAFVRGVGRFSSVLAAIGRPFAIFYGWIDTFLVRIGAAVVGTGHRSMRMRYIVLIGTMGALCVMSLYMPPPLGLIPAFIGFTLAIAVSRLWNWVEDDRALAALTTYNSTAPYKTDFREDFLDEALLGFAFVFFLAPMAMMQANYGGVFGEHLFQAPSRVAVEDWIGFFGVELAKAIPMVDWAEVYNVSMSDDLIKIDTPASRHAVFLARVMVDLVLIAALLQAFSVLTRNRHQKQLYDAGHIDRLDPFLERREFLRAMRAAQDAENFDLARLRQADVIDFRRYNEDQLRTLHGSSGDGSTRAFIEEIASQRGMHLGTAIDLTIGIAESNGNEVGLINAFERARQEHSQRTNLMEPDDLFRILTALRTRTGLRDFKQAVVDQLESVASPQSLIDALTGLAQGDKADHFLYARRYMTRAIERARARLT